MSESKRLTVITPKTYNLLRFSELWEFRELLYFFAWRDIKVRYKQTVLGFAWAFLQPTLQTIIFTFLMGSVMRFRGETFGVPTPVFVMLGLALWNSFAQGVNNGAMSLNQNANMIKKIFFPKLILPISSVVVVFFDMMFSLLLLAGLLVYYGISPHPLFYLYFLLALLLTYTSTVGLGMLFAAISVKYRDFRYVIPFSIQILFWLTPVIYSLAQFKNQVVSQILGANPIAISIEMSRLSLVGQPVDPISIVIGLAGAFLILAFGVFYFKRTEHYFADLA